MMQTYFLNIVLCILNYAELKEIMQNKNEIMFPTSVMYKLGLFS